MESEERASKKRKLSHEDSTEDPHSGNIENQQAKLRKNSLETEVEPEASDIAGGVPISDTPTDPRQHEDIETITGDNLPATENGTASLVEKSSDPKQNGSRPAENSQEGQPAGPVPQQQDKPMSKSQQKRLRKQAEWESKREERKVIRKQKQVEKRTRQRAERRAAGQEAAIKFPRPVNNNKPRPSYLPITILIDCDFDSLMKDNELVSLAAQITRCYSDNRKSRFRAHLALCSFGGRLRKRFNEVLTHHKKWKGVKILEDEDFVAAAERAKEWMREEKYGGKLVGAFERYAPPQEQQHANGEMIDNHLSANDDRNANDTNEVNGDDHTEEAVEQVAEDALAEHQANNPPLEATQPAIQETDKSADSAKAGTTAQAQPELQPQQQSNDLAHISALEQESEIIYLTSEATETLTELKPYSTYIIGGLVDKNREKGLCYRRATERGIRTARLPIGEFMEMQSRKVLATNHVSEIMVRWLECRDWGEAFMKVIPKRKGGKLLKGDGGQDGGEGDDGDGDEVVDDEDERGELERVEGDVDDDGDDDEDDDGGIAVEADVEGEEVKAVEVDEIL